MYLFGTIKLLNGAEPASYIRTIDISNLGNDNFYVEITDNWLAIVVSQLPKLRSLRLANSPMLDSKAMKCLQDVQHDNIRFIDVSYCDNATSERLSLIIALLPNLYFLDLSGHRGLRAAGVLNRIKKLASLKILRLKKCYLNDSDICELFDQSNDSSAQSIANIRSLDLSFNNLTDKCIFLTSSLSKDFTLSENITLPSYNESLDSTSRALKDEHPIYSMFQEKLKYMNLKERRQPVFEDDPAQVISYLENPNLPDPAVHRSRLTHLYISGNKITFKGLRELLTLHELEALDCGTIDLGDDGSLICSEEDAGINLPSLYEEFDKYNKLQYLRISHRLVTGFRIDSDRSDQIVSLLSLDLRKDYLLNTPP